MARTPRIPSQLTKGPFSLQEALAAGLTKSSLKGRSWRRLGPQLYCWRGFKEDSWRVLQAWLSRFPTGTVFVGHTAAWLHGLDTDPLHPIEIAVPPTAGIRSRPGLTVWRLNLSASEIVVIRGLHVTTLARTFRDLRRRIAQAEVLVLADQALRLGLGRFDALAAPAESPMETRLRWLLLRAGLPRPEVQSDLYDAAGRFLARADLYYPAAHLVIEFDGGNHRDRLVSDDRRQNALVEAGYRIMRFTSSDVYSRPDSVVRLVKACLQETVRTARVGAGQLEYRPSSHAC